MEKLLEAAKQKINSLEKELFNTETTVQRLTEQKKRLVEVLTEWVMDYEGWIEDTLPNGKSSVDAICHKAKDILSNL